MMKEYDQEYADNLFYSPTDRDKLGGIWPLRMGRNVAKPTYRSGPKIIDYYSIHFIEEGRVQVHYGDRSVVLGRGDVFVLFPKMTYTYISMPTGTPLRMMWLAIDGRQADSLLHAAGVRQTEPYLKSPDQEALNLRLSLYREFQRLPHPEAYYRLMSIFYEMISHMAKSEGKSAEPARTAWVSRSVDLMDTHFTENVSIQEIADHVGVSRSHFTTIFTKQVGMSPHSYLQRLKMNKAAEMLLGTAYSVTEIAMSIGYPDLYAFTRAFGHYYGKSPTQFREQR